jgi:dual specificity phosphatase 3
MSMTENLDPVHWWRTLCWVTDRIIVTGDLPDHVAAAERCLDDWVAAGVTTIVDLRGEWSDETFVADRHPHLTYVWAPTHDNGGAQSDDWFADTTERVLEQLAADPDAVVLIHCHMGVNRAPSLAMAVLLELGFTTTGALEAIRAARPIAGIIYADQAVDWFQRRIKSSDAQRHAEHHAAARWLADHPVDVSWVVSRIHRAELAPPTDDWCPAS